MERARTIWKELGLPALTVRPPWHGYSLGDWSDAWDAFARNAVAGEWEWERTARAAYPNTFARGGEGGAELRETAGSREKLGEDCAATSPEDG